MALCWANELKTHFEGLQAPSVLVLLPNSVEYLAVVLGGFAVGAMTCPGRSEYSDGI